MTLVPGHLATGAAGYLLDELEDVPGVAASAMNHVTPAKAISLGASFDVLRANVFFGSRHTEQVIRVLKGKIAGTVTQPLMANSAALYLLAGLGKEIWLPPQTVADATSAIITDSATGLSTLHMANAGGYTYRLGALTAIDSAGSGHQELVQTVGISGNGAAGTILTTKGLKPTTNRAAGTAVQQIGQHLFTTRGPLDSEAWDLPNLTFEKNVGRMWAWQLAGSKVAKFELKAGKEDIEMTNTMVCTVDPKRLDPGEFSVFNPSPEQRQELTRPFTIRDGYVVVGNDQLGTGTSYLSALYEIEAFTAAWDNHTMDVDFWNGHRIKDSFVGTTSGRITYEYATKAGRPSGYEDYLAREGAPPIPFFNTNAINRSADTTPDWQALGIYVPAMLVDKVDNPDDLGNIMHESVEATIVEDQYGAEPLQIFVANSATGVYTGL